jgi:hypothetical protein
VADVHPRTHPAKVNRSLCSVSFLPEVTAIAKMTAHATAHPMLYAV